METIQRMRGTSTPKGTSKPTRVASALQAINLSANVPTRLPLIISATYDQHEKKKVCSSTKDQSVSNSNNKPTGQQHKQQQLRFESPRLELADSQVFPTKSEVNHMADPEERWRALREQAGSHQQDGSVLRLRPNVHTPKVLKCGMPPQAAARVLELHVKVSGETLPAWMDAIASTFVNLQHLYVVQVPEEERENEVQQSVQRTSLSQNRSGGQTEQTSNDEDEANKVAEHSNRLKRLYILYRLPYLVSIDGVRVSTVERKLACPDDANGERVNRNEWVNHDDTADIRISLFDGEECVELNVLRQEASELIPDSSKIEECSSNVTHHEKSVEVDLAGKMVEVDNTQDGATKIAHTVSKEESEGNFEDTTGFRCGQLVLHENASVVTDDCEWTAACGLVMWRRSSIFNKQLAGDGDKKVKTNFRRSSSWKDCRKLVAANSIKSRRRWAVNGAGDSLRLPPLKPTTERGASRNSHYHGVSSSSEAATVQTSKSDSMEDRLGPLSFVESGENEMITRETTSRRPLMSNKLRHSLPRSSGPKQSSAKSSTTVTFPMQFHQKMAIPVSLCATTLAVITSQESSEHSQDATPPPMPPPPPSSSNNQGSPNVQPIDFVFSGDSKTSANGGKYQQITESGSDRDNSSLPPPFPPGSLPTRSRLKSSVPRQKRKKKRQGLMDKWKEQQSARSTSIMDGEADSEDDDECTESGSSESSSSHSSGCTPKHSFSSNV